MTARSPQRTNSLIRIVTLVSLLLVGCFSLGFTVFALDLLSSARAYITGESLWSSGQQDAVYHLERYAQTGTPEHLERARASLAIPLGDMRGRLALDEDPPDLKTAREGLLQGGNHADDIPSLIRGYRYFGTAPYIRDAIAIWVETDRYILAIGRVADALEQELGYGQPRRGVIDRLRLELAQWNEEVRPLAAAFTRTLTEGSRWLFRVLIVLSTIVIVLVLLIVSGVFRWATKRIAVSERKFRTAFEHVAIGMARIAPDGRFIDVNESLCSILGQPRESLLKRSLRDIVYSEDQGIDDERMKSLLQGVLDTYTVELRLIHSEGSVRWCKLTLSSVEHSGSLPRYLIAAIEDTSEARKLSSELDYQARHDALTGLINRREFEKRLDALTNDVESEGDQHALCFIDFDQFKVVNDTCGHAAGDALLREAADILHRHLRRGDILARLGGDEFGVLFTYCGIDAAVQVAEKLRVALAATTFSWEGANFDITVSMGLVAIQPGSSNAFSLLKEADTACYLAKDYGRNRVHVYSEDDSRTLTRRSEMEWVGRIQSAIRENRLQLAAQLISPLAKSNGIRYELLVRLVDSDGNMFMPGHFLPAAERYNIATLIDRWVTGKTLDLLEQHPAHLAQLDACHLNLSGQSLGRPEFLEFVESRLSESSVDPGKMCFEITETAAISSLPEARRFIDRLTQLGCRFALDDFGSGLSSFGYLRSLPVDIIKIDGCFVRHMHEDDVQFAMVRTVNEIGHLMGKRTVAEFVESEEILDMLRELGYDYAQGYAIHRPCDYLEILTEAHESVSLPH